MLSGMSKSRWTIAQPLEIRRHIDLELLARPGCDIRRLNQGYVPLRGIELSYARDILADEAEMMAAVDAAADDAAVDKILDDIFEEPTELGWLEPGVAGAVLALSAAGMV